MKLWLVLLLLLKVAFGSSQPAAIANLKQNIVYCGVDNPLLGVVSGYSCQSIILTTDNGKIIKSGCIFNYRPKEVGETKIKIWVKSKGKLKFVAQFVYRAKSLPPPVAFIGINRGGFISAEMLKRQGGVRAALLDFDIDAPFMVKSYTATATRDTTVLFTNRNIGAIYNDSLKNNLNLLQLGDSFLVSNIICVGPDGKDRAIAPLELFIKK